MTTYRRGGPLSYQLHVTAPTALEAVHHAGGFMFDLAMAGWKVTVAVAETADSAVLGVLGAETASAPVDGPDPHVCRLVCSTEHDTDDGQTVRYPLSSAARAFKTAALAVAGALDIEDIAVAPIESFRSERPPRSFAKWEDQALTAAAD